MIRWSTEVQKIVLTEGKHFNFTCLSISAPKSWAEDIKSRTRKWLPACGIIKVPFMEVRLEHLETIRKALKETISLVDCLSQSRTPHMKPLTIQQVFWITAKCVNHSQARTEKERQLCGWAIRYLELIHIRWICKREHVALSLQGSQQILPFPDSYRGLLLWFNTTADRLQRALHSAINHQRLSESVALAFIVSSNETL